MNSWKFTVRKKGNDQIIYCDNANIKRLQQAGKVYKDQNPVSSFSVSHPKLFALPIFIEVPTECDTTVTLLRHVSA
jgi:hypothetical protein